MRRPVLYLAGLLLATGASLALAGPASAAPSKHHCDRNHSYFNDDSYGFGYPGDDGDYWNSTDIDYISHSGNTSANGSGNNGISILDGVLNGGVDDSPGIGHIL